MSNHLLLSPAVAKALFWAAACICGVAHVAILRSVLRSAPRRTMEIAWAIIPAALLAVVLVMTWRNIAVSV
jgi:hypothetical protein